MSDPADQQAAFAELFVEMILQHLYPAPPPPLQQPMPVDTKAALEQLAEAMAIMYPSRAS